MGILKEEYVPIADALLASLSRDLDFFETENHLFNAAYLAAMQSKTDELRAKETGNAVLVQQKQTTQELYILGKDLNKPMKLLNLVLEKANIKTSLATDVLKKIRKRNFEGALMAIKSLKEVIMANSSLLIANGMKQDMIATLENAFTDITAKSNEQTSFQQQRKTFTSANKNLYNELYEYVSEVARLGKIIFQGEQKASEYTIDHLIAMVNVSRGGNKNNVSEEENNPQMD